MEASQLIALVESQDVLGEAPCWSASEARLYWVDARAPRIAWYDPRTKAHGAWASSFQLGALAARKGGGLIVSTEKGLAEVDTRSGEIRLVLPVDLGESFGVNDGKVDSVGRFWWSSMHQPRGELPGKIYRTDPDGSTHCVLEIGPKIANTLATSPDGRTLYLSDTTPGTITAYAVTPRGELVEPRAFSKVHVGGPDGGAVDVEGYLWIAEWAGSRLVRYAPDGRVDRVVPTPVSSPTSCAFGGEDLSTLFITSARLTLSDEALRRQPQAGALFAMRPGVAGLPVPEIAGWEVKR